MTFATIEVSAQDGQPRELYRFTRGSEIVYYTSSDTAITYLSQSYEPEDGLERTGVSQSEDFETVGVTLKVRRENTFFSKYLQYAPDVATSVAIFREHDGDGDFQTYFLGTVAGVTANGSEIEIELDNNFSTMKRQGIQLTHQRQCPYVLYGTPCGVNKDDFAVPCVVSAASGTTFTYIRVTDSTNPYLDTYYSGENLTAGTLTDDSGNGNDGTATDVTQVSSFVGNGLDFNGTTSKVVTTTTLPASADFAISFSISSDDTDGAIVSNDSAQTGGLQIKLTTGNLVQVLFESMTLVSTSTVSAAADTVVMLTHDDSADAWSLYIDGSLEDSGTEATTVDSAVFWIGANPDSSSFLDGTVDQIRFFDAIPSADAITYFATEDTNSTPLTDHFLAGMMKNSDGYYRFITSNSGTGITFNYPYEAAIANGDDVTLYPGCQKRFITDCTTKFSNGINYGGDPYRPTNDGPFTGRSIV